MGRRSSQARGDKRAELTLGASSAGVLAFIALMVVTVFAKAWPSFAHNGLEWFGPGGNVDQQLGDILNGPKDPATTSTTCARGRCIWGTILTTGAGGADRPRLRRSWRRSSSSSSRPPRLRRVIEPVVRLLAAVPSVIYGLIGILGVVPFVDDHLISAGAQGVGRVRRPARPARA